MVLTCTATSLLSSKDFQFLLQAEVKHRRLSLKLVILAGEASLVSPFPKFPQVEVGTRCGFFFLNQTLICPPDAVEADKEPICLIDPWHIWPCGRDCNIAVIPQQLQGAALWARCVGFKGSKRSQPCGKEKCWGFF